MRRASGHPRPDGSTRRRAAPGTGTCTRDLRVRNRRYCRTRAEIHRVAETGAWLLENGHRLALALTGGRYPRTVMGMLTVELHTVGRNFSLSPTS